MISLNSRLSHLALLNSRQLFEFSVKLLNLPAQGTHILRPSRRILSQVVRHDQSVRLEETSTRNNFTLQSFGNSLIDLLKGSDMLETNIDRVLARAAAHGVLLGKQEARQQGRHELVTLIESLLGKRFGLLADSVRTRLEWATTEQLEIWPERMLDSQTLGQVFNEH